MTAFDCLAGTFSRTSPLFFAVAALVLFAAAACSGGDEPAATAPVAPTTAATPAPTLAPDPTAASAPTSTLAPLSAREVLDATTAAMNAVTSVHVEGDITALVEVGDTNADFSVKMSGEVVVPDRAHVTMEVVGAGFSSEFEIIAIGSNTYMENPFTGAWEANAESPVPIGVEAFAVGAFRTDFRPEVSAAFSLTGIEDLDGERVYHLEGTVTKDDLADLMDDPDAREGEADAQYWVGVDDYLVRKTEIYFEDSGTAPDSSDVYSRQITYVTILSGYNRPVTIEAPEVVTGSVLFGSDDHGDTLETATPIEPGETLEGHIDDDFDFDIFRFQAMEGRSYRINVVPVTLESPVVGLYNSAGDEESWEVDGTSLLWEPLWTDDYFVLVEGFGETGTYTVSVTAE